jgi:hypothetical protein
MKRAALPLGDVVTLLFVGSCVGASYVFFVLALAGGR